MRIHTVLMAAAATVLVAAGCASKEEPAAQAVASAEAALTEIRPDAVKYAPQELEAADASLAKLKQKLEKEEFKEVLADAPQLGNQVTLLKETVISKQTQMAAATHEWERLSTEVPPMIDSMQRQIESLAGTRLPKELTKEMFAAAKSSLEAMKSTWAEAGAAFSAGNAAEAADKGRIVEAKGQEVSAQLGMSPM